MSMESLFLFVASSFAKLVYQPEGGIVSPPHIYRNTSMCEPQDTLPIIVDPTPFSPNSSTVIHCDECGTMSIAWHEGKWTTDCLYDCCCLHCFMKAIEDDGPCINSDADLFPNRIELDVNGFITIFRSDGCPWGRSLNRTTWTSDTV